MQLTAGLFLFALTRFILYLCKKNIMAYSALITTADTILKQQTGGSRLFNEAVRKAQDVQPQNLLGKPLYYQLTQTTTDGSIYQDLWNGVVYSDINGDSVELVGVKQWLIAKTESIYYGNSKAVDSGVGMVTQSADVSKEDKAENERVSKLKKYEANRYFDDIVLFLDYKSDTYTLWNGRPCREWTGGIF